MRTSTAVAEDIGAADERLAMLAYIAKRSKVLGDRCPERRDELLALIMWIKERNEKQQGVHRE